MQDDQKVPKELNSFFGKKKPHNHGQNICTK